MMNTPTDKNSFSIEFTSEKNYDLEKISKSHDREDSETEILVKVVNDNDKIFQGDSTESAGEIAISETREKIKISRKDIRNYLFK